MYQSSSALLRHAGRAPAARKGDRTIFQIKRRALQQRISSQWDQLTPFGPREVTDLLNPGKSAVVTTAEGLRIGCIGGTYKAAVYSGSEIPHVRIHLEVNHV